MTLLARLLRCTRGAAAAEMALVSPFLILLMFGSIELGHMFMSHHAVQKGVRDGARYAARVPLGTLTDSGCILAGDTTAQDSIKRVTRTGDPDDGGSDPRLFFWTDNATVTLEVECTTGTYAGLYSDFPDGAPVVTVAASVPYPPLFDWLPFVDSSMTLNSESQAAVFGA